MRSKCIELNDAFHDNIGINKGNFFLWILLNGKKYCRIHWSKFDIGRSLVFELNKRRMCIRAQWRWGKVERERERGSGRRGRFEFLDKLPPPCTHLFPRETMVEWRGKTSRISLNQRWCGLREEGVRARDIGEAFCGVGQKRNRFRPRPCVQLILSPRGFL